MWNRSFCQLLRKGFTLLHACGTQKHGMPRLMHASYFQYCSMPFTIHCPENTIWFNLSIQIPSISNKTNSSVPLNFFTHKYLHWVCGSTQPLKSSWRSWSININFFAPFLCKFHTVISHRVIMMSQKHCILILLIGWWYMQSRCKTGMCTFQIIISLLVGPMMRAFWPPT